VLRVANELGLDDLPDDLALNARAADAIVQFKAGADDELGTSDDRAIDSLAVLDAIPWVGTKAFGALLSFARAHGYVGTADPFDAGFCGGDVSVTRDQLIARFGTNVRGGAAADLANDLMWVARSRICTEAGCTAWRVGGWQSFHQGSRDADVYMGDGGGWRALATLGLATDASGTLAPTMRIDTLNPNVSWYMNGQPRTPQGMRVHFASLTGAAPLSGSMSIGTYDIGVGAARYDASEPAITGTVGAHCMNIRSARTVGQETVEMAIVGRY